MQSSLSFVDSPARPFPTRVSPRRPRSRRSTAAPSLSPVPGQGPTGASAHERLSAGAPDTAIPDPGPTGDENQRRSITLQVIRDGTGLAGLALWAWACLRLLGAG